MHQYILVLIAISERIMSVRIPLTQDRSFTPISGYAPILTSEDEIKVSFHNLLDRTIQAVPAHDKLVVMGDFNARVRNDHRLRKGIPDNHGIGSSNAVFS